MTNDSNNLLNICLVDVLIAFGSVGYGTPSVTNSNDILCTFKLTDPFLILDPAPSAPINVHIDNSLNVVIDDKTLTICE